MRTAADDPKKPSVTPRWRRRLGRWLYGRVRWVYPEMCARHDLLDRSLPAAHAELKAAWRVLDRKNEEIAMLRREGK